MTKKVDVSKTTDAYRSNKNDPNGSYTGVCTKNKFEKPIQDADDL